MVPTSLAARFSLATERLQGILRRPTSLSSSPDDDYSEQDAETNVRSTPPPGEYVDLRCIWGIEFYTPSYIDNLVSHLQDIDSGVPGGIGSPRDPILWLRGLRRHRDSSSTLHLGRFTTEESPSFFGPTRRVPRLPLNVKYAHGQISSLSPSLVAIVLCFTLDESLSASINTSLRKDRISFLVPNPRGYSIRDPYAQKRNEIAGMRLELQKSICDWFAEYVPGVFTVRSGDIPTCELITAKDARPFILGESKGRELYSYLGLVGFETGMDSWRADTVEGLIFDIPRDTYHPHIAVNDSDLQSHLPDGYESPRTASIHFVDQLIASVLKAWAILPLVEHYTREVATTSIPAEDRPEQTLDAIKRSTLSRIDITALSSELTDKANANIWLWDEARKFVRVGPLSERFETTLGEGLEFLVQKQAAWLKETDRSARESSAQYGNLLAAAESIRLQKTVRWLTWVLVGLAGLTIAMSFVAAKCF